VSRDRTDESDVRNAALEEAAWQPMDTAPKDRPILAYNPMMGVYNTQYQSQEPDERDRWPCGFSGWSGTWYCWPTHWMPVPKPPEPVPAPKPFTFADPARQVEHERHRAESRRVEK
jgi:hypothetical protein